METKEKRRAVSDRPKKDAKPTAQRSNNSASPKNRRPPAQAATARRKPRAASPEKTAAPKRRRTTQTQVSPDVVYTQPTPFNKGRFILNLLIVGAVVLALIFGMSIFFKVDTEKTTVSGTNKYTPMQILQAAGLKDGENLLSISEARIANNIQRALPYVDKVRVGIKLPDTVKIEIVELAVVYSLECDDGSWWLVSADGNVIEKTNDADAGLHTKILGVKLKKPVVGEKAIASQPEATTPEDETTPEGETAPQGATTPVTVLAQDQLDTAITIADYMETAGIIGEATSVDVTNLADLQIWYGERFQILLGDKMELGYKIRLMQSTLEQMGQYQGGVLDISFTIRPDEVVYTPFSKE